jgi:hypothetical protein
MDANQIGMLAGQFGLSLLLSMIWLGLRNILPGLRTRIGVSCSHCIALLVALAACIAPVVMPGPARFIAAIPVAAFLFLHWKRSLRNDSLKADTIICY